MYREEAEQSYLKVAGCGVAPSIHQHIWLCRGADGLVKITTFWESPSVDRCTPARIASMMEDEERAEMYRGKTAQQLFESLNVPFNLKRLRLLFPRSRRL
jgi:hypothetical protein